MAYSWRSLTPLDAGPWAELVAVLAAHDATDELYSAEDLAEELEFPGVDPAVDTFAVDDDAGTLVAFAQVFFREALVDGQAAADTSGGVHPQHRGQGIGSALVDRLQVRASTGNAVRHPGVATALRVECGVQVAPARALFADLGFAEARFFHEMTHDLVGVDPDAPWPAHVRRYRAATDEEAVRVAHNAAFADHWRFAPRTEQEWTTVVRGGPFRPDLSFVQVGGEGSIVGYVLCAQYAPGELYVMNLGVDRKLRGHGVGAGLLRTALTAAVAAGYERAALGVDTDNGSSAMRLYESVGFGVSRSRIASIKILPA